MPTVKGRKSPSERFAGADDTYTIEALMQNGWALQSGTRVHDVLMILLQCILLYCTVEYSTSPLSLIAVDTILFYTAILLNFSLTLHSTISFSFSLFLTNNLNFISWFKIPILSFLFFCFRHCTFPRIELCESV